MMNQNIDPMVLAAQAIIQNNQGRIPNTPWAQAAVNAVMSNNPTEGQKIANNLCQTYGIDQSTFLQQAKNMLGLR